MNKEKRYTVEKTGSDFPIIMLNVRKKHRTGIAGAPIKNQIGNRIGAYILYIYCGCVQMLDPVRVARCAFRDSSDAGGFDGQYLDIIDMHVCRFR